MAAEKQEAKGSITLKGSAELVKEYLDFGINSILYQRGIYPGETFVPVEHFGITLFMTTDEKIKKFLSVVLGQIQEWLIKKKLQKISLVITNSETKEVMERWDFKIQYEGDKNGAVIENGAEVGNKDIKVIQREIREVMRQILATVSFLPLLDCVCCFDILIYTVPDCEVPDEWDETQPCFIANSQEVRLRTFSTSLHKTETLVSYKAA
ncbi:hypothetical protein L9F63_003230 [Diploptera punctata]|uniref:Mitotic spindle assembly checkpoint protein MAD2A n=1 Tax=Diploptera punctata TaxID=6984 RepID=A0AAD8EA94_DIPPU|nr:hypothetical protein L9F63_003230 [Diploptera punctata]